MLTRLLNPGTFDNLTRERGLADAYQDGGLRATYRAVPRQRGRTDSDEREKGDNAMTRYLSSHLVALAIVVASVVTSGLAEAQYCWRKSGACDLVSLNFTPTESNSVFQVTGTQQYGGYMVLISGTLVLSGDTANLGLFYTNNFATKFKKTFALSESVSLSVATGGGVGRLVRIDPQGSFPDDTRTWDMLQSCSAPIPGCFCPVLPCAFPPPGGQGD